MGVVISGMGMVTSVGRTAAAACAAIRAGLSRPRRCRHHLVLDSETQAPTPLTGHPIRGYTEGFAGSGLWLRLAHGAIRDLLISNGLPPASMPDFWRRTGLLAVTPALTPERFQLDDGNGLALIESAFLHPLVEALALPFSKRHVLMGGVDHAGTAEALRSAVQILAQGACARVLLVAVDSYLESLTLQWLGEEDRLKAGDVPTGLSPGEAGVCLLLERKDSALRRHSPLVASLAAVAASREPSPFTSGETNSGAGLAECVREALDTGGFEQRYSGEVFSDLNGETWRAHEWGSALVRLAGRLDAPRLHLPCVSVGDTGAASGALGVCLAAHGLARGHTRTSTALVVSSSMDGPTGCIALRAAAS